MNEEIKTQELTNTINSIKIPLFFMDLDYAKEAAEQFRKQASWQDSAAILNPRYSPTQSKILYMQSEALGLLVKYVETLKEVDKLKHNLSLERSAQDDIMKMFM